MITRRHERSARTRRGRSIRGGRVWGLCLVIALLLAACGGAQGADDSAAADATADSGAGGGAASESGDTGSGQLQEVSLRFNINAYAPHVPFVYAADQGFYKEEGLTVTFGEGTGSETTGALVAEGDDDFGTVDFPGVTALIAEDAPIQSVAIIEQRSPLAVISKTDSEIEQPSDLAGTSIVMEGGDLGIFEAFAQVADFDVGAIETVTLADEAQSAALEQGRVDGIFGWTTSQGAETLELSGGVKDLLFADYGFEMVNLTLATSTDMIENEPETVCAFTRASMRGFEATQEDMDAAIDAFVAAFPNVNPDIVRQGLEQQLALLQTDETQGEPLGYVPMDIIDGSLETLTETGTLEESLDAERVYSPMCFDE